MTNPSRLAYNAAQRQEHHDPEDNYQNYNVEVEVTLKRVYQVRAGSKARAEDLAAMLADRDYPNADFMLFDAEVDK